MKTPATRLTILPDSPTVDHRTTHTNAPNAITITATNPLSKELTNEYAFPLSPPLKTPVMGELYKTLSSLPYKTHTVDITIASPSNALEVALTNDIRRHLSLSLEKGEVNPPSLNSLLPLIETISNALPPGFLPINGFYFQHLTIKDSKVTCHPTPLDSPILSAINAIREIVKSAHTAYELSALMNTVNQNSPTLINLLTPELLSLSVPSNDTQQIAQILIAI